MLKNKFKIITLLSVILLCLTIPVALAEDIAVNQSINEENSTSLISDSQNETKALENFKKEDVYLIGDNITIDYIVDGNLFVMANSVTIKSQIGGDAFIIAKDNINIDKQGYVFSNLFALTPNMTISGVVYDLYTTSKNVTLNGYIYRDVKIVTNDLTVNGMIGRNAFVRSNKINFATSNSEEQKVTSQGKINGNLTYTAKEEFNIPKGAVDGKINFEKVLPKNSQSIQSYILSLGKFITTIAIIWLICLWLLPKFLQNTNNKIASKKILSVIGHGILTPILLVILSIVLLLLKITSSIGILGIGLLLIAFSISIPIFVIAINNIICNKLKIEKKQGIFGMLILSSAIIWLITLIPYVGTIISAIAIIIGLGLLTTRD